MKFFFSVDWGTSSLRVRFVEVHNHTYTILHEKSDNCGLSRVYQLYQAHKAEYMRRADFFLRFLRPYLWSEKLLA